MPLALLDVDGGKLTNHSVSSVSDAPISVNAGSDDQK
jgi:hypothetical protein